MKISGKLLFAIVVLGLFCVLYGGIKASCNKKSQSVNDYTTRDMMGMENADKEDAKSDKKEDIRYKTLSKSECIKSDEEYNAIPNEKYAWWFKRDKNHGPSDCDHSVDISKYGAFFRDCRCDLSAETEKVIYLTFDCGYENGLTEKMMDVLDKYQVPACFFVTQTYIRDNPDIVKRMKESGYQVGNHTIHHAKLYKLDNQKVMEEIKGCYDYMKEATGYDMDPYFRPPCGEYSERVLSIANDLGYKTIFWSMAYFDYDVNKQPGVEYVTDHFEKYHHNGAIVLMHNVSCSNLDALETVIKGLLDQGYRFASLNELEM